MKVLKLAAEQGIPIHEVTLSNFATVSPYLGHPADVLQAVKDSVNTGKTVIIPRQPVTSFDWTGTGYLVMDPSTGASASLITGQLAGGVLALSQDCIESIEQFVNQYQGAISSSGSEGLNEMLAFLNHVTSLNDIGQTSGASTQSAGLLAMTECLCAELGQNLNLMELVIASINEVTLFASQNNLLEGDLPSDEFNPLEICIAIEIISVDASDPYSVKVNYRITPSGTVIDSATFTAPGREDTKHGLFGEFYFIFDQNALDLIPGTIQLLATINNTLYTTNFTFNRSRKVTPPALEIVSAYFLVEGVGLRLYLHTLTEVFHEVSYSVPYFGKTIWVGESVASLNLGKDFSNINNSDWTEYHEYRNSGGSIDTKAMTTSLGLGNPDTRHKVSFSNLWPETINLTGIASVVNLIYQHDTDAAPATPIINKEVDRAIP